MFKTISAVEENTILANMDMQRLKASKLDQLRNMAKVDRDPEEQDDEEILGIHKACNNLWLKDKVTLKDPYKAFLFYEAQAIRASCLQPGDIFLPGICHDDPPIYQPYICLSRDFATNTIYVNLASLKENALSFENGELEEIALKDLFKGIINNDLVTLYEPNF